jgi:hypothetical protein
MNNYIFGPSRKDIRILGIISSEKTQLLTGVNR